MSKLEQIVKHKTYAIHTYSNIIYNYSKRSIYVIDRRQEHLPNTKPRNHETHKSLNIYLGRHHTLSMFKE